MSSTVPELDIEYPSTDGEPLGEATLHFQAIVHLFLQLRQYFRAHPDVLIASDLFWYFQRGNVNARLAPDIMIVPGVGNHPRQSFRSWDEPNTPSFILEFTSESTIDTDVNDKYIKYEQLQVPEYFLFDTSGEDLHPPLQGHRLENGIYQPIPMNEQGEVVCSMGFSLRSENGFLRMIETETGEPILLPEEQNEITHRQLEEAQRAAEQARANFELSLRSAEQAAQASKEKEKLLEAEIARLKALLNHPGNGS
jgi:Uma2 family endonuclease